MNHHGPDPDDNPGSRIALCSIDGCTEQMCAPGDNGGVCMEHHDD